MGVSLSPCGQARRHLVGVAVSASLGDVLNPSEVSIANKQNQLAMFYQAQAKIGARDRAMTDMIRRRENPMTRQDLDAPIRRRPNVYGRYAGLRKHLPEQARHSLAELQAMFATEAACGIYYAPMEGGRLDVAWLPNGEEMGRCTNCAWYVVDRLNEGDVYGFYTDDNPVVTHREILGCGGHDFAVIGNRYIVDIWVSLYNGAEEQVVYDLGNSADADKIRALYGDTRRWERFDPVTRKIQPRDLVAMSA